MLAAIAYRTEDGGHAWQRYADPYAEALKEAMRCIYQWANGVSPKKG